MDRDYEPTAEGQKLINNRIGSIFFLCLNSYFGVLSNTTFKMSKENSIIYKEIKSRMYTALDFFLAKTLVDMLFLVLPIMLCTIPVKFNKSFF